MNQIPLTLLLTEEDRKKLKKNRLLFTTKSLSRDLEEGQKIRSVGRIIDLKKSGRYSTKMIFQPKGSNATEEFPLSIKFINVGSDAYNYSKEVEIEYAPHTRFLFYITLLTPLTAEEKENERKSINVTITFLSILLAIPCILMAWHSGLWMTFGVMYLCVLMFFIFFLRWNSQ